MGCFENDDWDIVALGCPDPDCFIHCWKEWVKGTYIWRGFSSEFQIQHHFLSTYCIPSSRHFLFTISGSSHCSWYFSYHTITWRHEPYVSRIHCLPRKQPWSSHLERGMYIYTSISINHLLTFLLVYWYLWQLWSMFTSQSMGLSCKCIGSKSDWMGWCMLTFDYSK